VSRIIQRERNKSNSKNDPVFFLNEEVYGMKKSIKRLVIKVD